MRGIFVDGDPKVLIQHLILQGPYVLHFVDALQAGMRFAQKFVETEFVKGAEPYAVGAAACEFHYARLHFVCGFVGKSQAENVFTAECRVTLEQVANAPRDDARLSRARARDDEQRAFAVLHHGGLFRIQFGE